MGQWGKLFIEGSKKLGSSVTVVEDGTQKKAMEEAGFVNVQEFDFKVSPLLPRHGILLTTYRQEPYWHLAERPGPEGYGGIQ